MSITAGDIRATMTLDTGQFSSGMASARAELTTIEADGNRVVKAFAQLENRMGTSASAIAGYMQTAGTSSASLMEALGRADGAAAKVDALAAKASQAAQAMTGAQAAAKQSADKLALLEESAQATAENLQAARQELDALRASGTASAAAIGSAEKAVARFSDEAEEMARQLQAARNENDQNTAALTAAQNNYQKLSAQLLTAEGSAAKANDKLSQLTQTLQAGGKFSLSGLLDSLSSMGSSTLTSASRSLSTIAVNAAGIGSSTAVGTLATNGLSTALTALVKTLGGASLGLAGVGAAAVYAGYKLYSAYQNAHDGEKLWEEAYAGVPEERTTQMKNIIEAGVELKTEGLSGQVESVYKQIGDALTDGEPDTATVIASIQEKSTGLFSSVRARIQAWYNAEMANLDLSTTAGVQKAQALTGEYNTLMDRVDTLDENTGVWIASYAGKSTEECTKALSQLQTYEDELERLARRADELTALLQSNQKAAYTTVSNSLTTDSTTVGNAVAYVQTDYALKLGYAEEDHNTQMAALWQEYQQKLQSAANEQEKLQIDAEYEVKLQEANDAYAGTQAQLEANYKQMLANVVQGVAEAAAKTDPQLAEAIEKAISGDFKKLKDLKIDNAELSAAMKNLVEAGALDGITDADLSTTNGQLEAMVKLLAQGTQEAAQAALNNMHLVETEGLSGVLTAIIGAPQDFEDNPTERIAELAEQVKQANQLLEDTGSAKALQEKLALFRMAFSMPDSANPAYDKEFISGTERMAQFITTASEAADAGNLAGPQLEQFGLTISNLLSVLDVMNAAGGEENAEFLTELSSAMNELGHVTTPENVVDYLHTLWDAWQPLQGMENPDLKLNMDVELPSPEELLQIMAAAGAGASSAYAQSINDGSTAAEGASTALASAAQGPVTSAAAVFQSAGSNAGSSFIAGIRSKLSAAAAAGTAIGSAAYNALKARLKIASPSRVAREAGGFFGEGFAMGISDSITMSEKSVASLADASARALGSTNHNNYSNAITINLSGATMRSDDDVRMLARSLGKYINDANYGVS